MNGASARPTSAASATSGPGAVNAMASAKHGCPQLRDDHHPSPVVAVAERARRSASPCPRCRCDEQRRRHPHRRVCLARRPPPSARSSRPRSRSPRWRGRRRGGGLRCRAGGHERISGRLDGGKGRRAAARRQARRSVPRPDCSTGPLPARARCRPGGPGVRCGRSNLTATFPAISKVAVVSCERSRCNAAGRDTPTEAEENPWSSTTRSRSRPKEPGRRFHTRIVLAALVAIAVAAVAAVGLALHEEGVDPGRPPASSSSRRTSATRASRQRARAWC